MRAVERILTARSHFEVLQLPMEHTTCRRVRTSFLTLSKQVHPDHCAHPAAGEAFKRLSESYQALRSPRARTARLEFEKRRRPDSPLLVALDYVTRPAILAAAVAAFVAAELLRLAVDDDEEAPTPPPPVATLAPAAPVFSVDAGLPLVGTSSRELRERLQDRRQR